MVSEDGRSERFGSGCFSHSLYLKFRKLRLILGKVNKTDSVRKRNIEARSCNHYCCGKAVSIILLSVCSLSYPACNAHVPYYIVICGLLCCTIFFHIIS
jgi:hypothetical protein